MNSNCITRGFKNRAVDDTSRGGTIPRVEISFANGGRVETDRSIYKNKKDQMFRIQLLKHDNHSCRKGNGAIFEKVFHEDVKEC